ncbi:MAG: ATP-binding cassette domain-containing protein [Erysipelotrichaceae bacterium]
MWKLRRYFMPYWYILVAIVVLLFGQAMADLALPEYMAKIVNNGIQTSGIEGAQMEIVSKTTFEEMQVLLLPEEQTKLQSAYTLVEANASEQSSLQKTFKGLVSQDVYVLNSLDQATLDEVEPLIAKALIVRSLFSGNENQVFPTNENIQAFLDALPSGVSVFDALLALPDAQRTTIITQINTQLDVVQSTNLIQGASLLISEEYNALGIDVENYQLMYMMRIGTTMIAITLFGAIATILVGLLSARTAAAFGRDLRDAIFVHVTDFSNQEFDQFSTASLITRTTNDITQIQMVLVMLLRFVFYAPIMGIGGIIKVTQTDTNMIWIVALGLALLGILIGFLFMVALPKFKKVQLLLDRLNLVSRESLTGMLVIRAFVNEATEEKKFDEANRDVTRVNLFVNRSMAIMMPSMMFIMNGVTLLIIWFGAKQIDLGTMQVGDMMAFMQYAMQIIMSFLFISIVFITLPRASVSALRIAEVLNTKLSVLEPKKPTATQDNRGVVEFKNVCFAYPGAEECVIRNISFTAKPGQTTAFIGSTGSGKSTLINLVPRFYDVTNGEILVDGEDIRNIASSDLRARIGYVPQKGLLFSGTIASNLRFGNESLDSAALDEIAMIAQAKDFIEAKPERYDEPIAQGGSNVSGGQKQRLSIARALARKPKILIFDDSFSALDFKTDQRLRHALQEKVHDATILLVAQRVASIMQADQIIVLDQGEIVGVGTHETLLQTCPIYQEIAASQLSKEELAHA